MAVWCGQCQARNEGQPDWCANCGAPLRPLTEVRKPTALPGQAAGARVIAYDPVTYDRQRLARQLAACFPDRGDLVSLADHCRIAYRMEGSDGGRGHRVYFLPEGPNGHTIAEKLSGKLGAESITLALVRDPRNPSHAAIYWMEQVSRPLSASLSAKLAQYEQIAQDRRATRLQLYLAPLFATALVLVLLFVSMPAALSSIAYAPIFLVGAAAVASILRFQTALLRDLTELERAMGLLRENLDLGGSDLVVPSHDRPLGRHGAPLVLAAALVLLLWLAARSFFSSGATVGGWEGSLVAAVSLLAYPVIVFLQNLRQWVDLRRLRGELVGSAEATSPAPSRGEPPSFDSDAKPE